MRAVDREGDELITPGGSLLGVLRLAMVDFWKNSMTGLSSKDGELLDVDDDVGHP